MSAPLLDAVIERVEVFVLRAPLGKEKFWSSQASFPERNSLLVKYGPPEPVAAAIEHVLGPRIIGKRVQPSKLQADLYAFSMDFGQRGTYVEAISGIDVACWDLLGRLLGVPVCELLGGAHRDSVAVYGTGCYYRHNDDSPATIDVDASVAEAAAEAASFKEAGMRGVKMKIGLLSVDDDIKRVAAVREALGDLPLMVDANHAYSIATALRVAQKLEPFDVRWLEEPLLPETLHSYARLRDRCSIPLAAGECSFTKFGFRDLVAGPGGSPVLDIIQPDIAACGGLTEFKKILALTQAFGVSVVPHVWGSAVGLAAALHAVATIPLQPYTANPVFMEGLPVIEFDRNPNPLRDELLGDMRLTLNADGCLPVPMGPGLGIEVDEAAVAKFTVPITSTGVVAAP